MTIEIDLKTLEATVREIAAEEPDFRYHEQNKDLTRETENGHQYPYCSYVGRALVRRNEGRGCIMGQALQRLGLPKETLTQNDWGPIHHLLSVLEGLHIIKVTGGKIDPWENWFATVQSEQDLNMTWGDAVRRADNNHHTTS